jgi:hypothetical protein
VPHLALSRAVLLVAQVNSSPYRQAAKLPDIPVKIKSGPKRYLWLIQGRNATSLFFPHHGRLHSSVPTAKNGLLRGIHFR